MALSVAMKPKDSEFYSYYLGLSLFPCFLIHFGSVIRHSAVSAFMYDPCTAGKRHAKYPVYQDQELHKGGYMQLLMNIFMHYILPDRRSVSGREQKPEQLGCIHSQTSRFFMLNTSNLSQSLLPLYGSCRGTTYTIYLHVEPLDEERKIRLREREINGQEGNMNIDDSVHERRII